MTSRDNFEEWFTKALEPLKPNSNTGLIFVMLAFPLLERYLRGLFRDTKNLDSKYHQWLESEFSLTSGLGKHFWGMYRHGLLHQVSFNSRKYKGSTVKACIAGYGRQPVYFNSGEKTFYLNPIEFFNHVTQLILDDFDTFNQSSLPFPTVYFPETAESSAVPTTGCLLE